MITEHNINEHKRGYFLNEVCVHCGRKYPETVLNIEGYIHHKLPFECLDKKSCKKASRKKNNRRK